MQTRPLETPEEIARRKRNLKILLGILLFAGIVVASIFTFGIPALVAGAISIGTWIGLSGTGAIAAGIAVMGLIPVAASIFLVQLGQKVIELASRITQWFNERKASTLPLATSSPPTSSTAHLPFSQEKKLNDDPNDKKEKVFNPLFQTPSIPLLKISTIEATARDLYTRSKESFIATDDKKLEEEGAERIYEESLTARESQFKKIQYGIFSQINAAKKAEDIVLLTEYWLAVMYVCETQFFDYYSAQAIFKALEVIFNNLQQGNQVKALLSTQAKKYLSKITNAYATYDENINPLQGTTKQNARIQERGDLLIQNRRGIPAFGDLTKKLLTDTEKAEIIHNVKKEDTSAKLKEESGDTDESSIKIGTLRSKRNEAYSKVASFKTFSVTRSQSMAANKVWQNIWNVINSQQTSSSSFNP